MRRLTIIYSRLGSCTTGKKIPFERVMTHISVSRIFLSIIRFFCYYPLVVERDPRNREIQLEDLGNSYMECEA